MEGFKVTVSSPEQAVTDIREGLKRAGLTDVDHLVEEAREAIRSNTGPQRDLYIFASAWFFFITPY